jgi:hypothetical protein
MASKHSTIDRPIDEATHDAGSAYVVVDTGPVNLRQEGHAAESDHGALIVLILLILLICLF